MSGAATRYLGPALFGAVVCFAVRLVMGDLRIAVIGVVVFALIFSVLLVLARAMKWPDAPMLNAVVAAVATTVAFLVSHQA